MKYEGKIRVELSAGVSVDGTSREDAKRKLELLHERLVKFLESEGMVDEVYIWKQESYVYTDENWKSTPRLDDERYWVYEDGGDREYFEEYYDGDETRIEDAMQSALEAELEILKEIEVGEIYFKERFQYRGEDCVSYRNVRKNAPWLSSNDESEPSSDGDLVDAIFAYGEDEADGVKICVDMKSGVLIYEFGMRDYELVEAEKYWERNSDDDYSERKFQGWEPLDLNMTTKTVKISIAELVEQGFEIEVPVNATKEEIFKIARKMYDDCELVVDNGWATERDVTILENEYIENNGDYPMEKF